MNNQTSRDAPAATERRGSEASGKHQGLRRPEDDQRVEQALDQVGLEGDPEAVGEAVEDELRDRRGSGIPAVDDVRGDGDDDGRSGRR